MTRPVQASAADHRELARLLDNAGRDPASRDAARTLDWAIRNHQRVISDGTLLAWLQLWRHGLRPSLVTDGIAGQHDLNQLTRATLRLDRHLRGPDLQLGVGLRVAAGDQLVVTANHPRRADQLEPGVLLHVIDVHPAGRACTVDIPTFGEQRHISSADPLVRRVSHAYAIARSTEQERNLPGAARQPARGLSW